MHHVLGTLVIGALAGGLAGRRVGVRPALRKVVKAGIVSKRKIGGITATAREEMQKLVAEARADLDHGMEQHN